MLVYIDNQNLIDNLINNDYHPLSGDEYGAWFYQADLAEYYNHKTIVSMCGASHFID